MDPRDIFWYTSRKPHVVTWHKMASKLRRGDVVSSLNVTSQFLEAPNLLSGSSLVPSLPGHTMHTGAPQPLLLGVEHGGHSPTVCQSPSSYAFFMGQLGKVGFLPVEISDFRSSFKDFRWFGIF